MFHVYISPTAQVNSTNSTNNTEYKTVQDSQCYDSVPYTTSMSKTLHSVYSVNVFVLTVRIINDYVSKCHSLVDRSHENTRLYDVSTLCTGLCHGAVG